MEDLVSVLETYCDNLGWSFTYGNKANNNLLRSDKECDKVYLLLDPITRDKAKSEYGGTGEVSFSGSFLLVVKSTLDNNYHNQKGQDKETGKYKKNIEPLLIQLELLENVIDCSQYEIESWSIVDAINALDVNMDGIVVTFKIKTL